MPMADEELQAYLDRVAPNPQARAYIEQARNSPPARRVQSGKKRNTVWRYASQKMGVIISGESTLEKHYHVLLDFDPDVVEFWDQPPTLHLIVNGKNGRCRRVSYTPDVLVLAKDGIYLDQVKAEAACKQLVADQPSRWVHEGNGFQDKEAARHTQAMGITHRVVSEEQVNPVMANNLLAIGRADALPRDRDYRKTATRLLQLLDKQGAVIAAEAMASVGISGSTYVLQMLADRLIVANLSDGDIGALDKVWLAIDPAEIERIRAAVRVQRGSLVDGQVKVATSRDAAAILGRLQAINTPGLRPKRTVRRWRKLLRSENGNVLGLVPKTRCRGNRIRRLSKAELELIRRVIRTHHMSPSAPTPAASYRRYLNEWDEACARGEIPSGARPVTDPTFRREIERIDLEEREAARGGRRAANAAAAPVPPDKKEPRSARPFERGHIDHYLADVHTLICVEGKKKVTRRLWVSVLRDEWSGAVLGLAMRLKAPSRVACALVVRDCVRRHRRLPETIVVDNGKEFESTYFEVLLARYGISKQSRPPGAPRFGSTIEAFYKSMRDFARTLPGSTGNDARGRSVSPKLRGQAQASLDIEATFNAIEKFCFEGFNLNPLRDRLQCPQRLLDEGLRLASYSGISVDLNEQFLALSAIPTGRRPKVDPRRGIKHLDRWFFSIELLRSGASKHLDILQEPWDENCIYAVIDGRAVACYHGRESRAWEYSSASMLRAIMRSEAADIRAKNAKARGKSLDKIVAVAVKTGSKEARSEQPGKQSPTLLPTARKGLKPFRTYRWGER